MYFLHVCFDERLVLLGFVFMSFQLELDLWEVRFDKLEGLIQFTDFYIFSWKHLFCLLKYLLKFVYLWFLGSLQLSHNLLLAEEFIG